MEGLIFPAFRRPAVVGKAAEAIVAAEDAGCFYHPQSRAAVPCDLCGRFLCALCDLELNGQHVCPGCLETGRKKKTMQNYDGDRVIYGRMALLLAVLPFFFWPITILTGPAAVFFAIYGWRKPRSLTGGGHTSHVIAILLGLLETGVWVYFLSRIFLK